MLFLNHGKRQSFRLAGALVFCSLFGRFADAYGRVFAFLKSVPFAAVRAAAQPACRFVAAGRAHITGFFLGQGDAPVPPQRGRPVIIVKRLIADGHSGFERMLSMAEGFVRAGSTEKRDDESITQISGECAIKKEIYRKVL